MTHSASDPLRLDSAALRAACNKAAETFDAAAALQAEVRGRLLERLDYVRIEPRVIIDLGAATGRASEALAGRYPDATVIAVDFAENMLRQARSRSIGGEPLPVACADAGALPLASASVDLIFCSLMLHCCNDLKRVLTECRRVLRPHGLLSLATFGPDTLFEMRAAWSGVDQASHVHRFPDMHNVGDGMLGVGLAEPVLDAEHFTLTYKTVRGIMKDLKAIGAQNATIGRPRGLCGRRRMQQVSDAYEQFRENERLPATFEVVYGQSWGRGAGQAAQTSGKETRIPLSDVGRRGRGEG